LNLTNAVDAAFDIWNATVPTDAVFSVGSSTKTNASGGSYVAYLFAHNDGDGEFGGEADADIIKCGSFTSDGSSDYDIDLGFEPQLLILKRATGGTANWFIQDNIREFSTDRSDILFPNLNNAEGNYVANYIPLSTGFGVRNGVPSGDHIYIAIRRGPMGIPESASEVFDVYTGSDSSYKIPTGFVTDAVIGTDRSGNDNYVGSRLTGRKAMTSNTSNSEATYGNSFFTDVWQHNDGVQPSLFGSSTAAYWLWKRAPSFFDVVAYTGNSTAGRTVSHNLGVAPEMIWVKARNQTYEWAVHHKDVGFSNILYLNLTNAEASNPYFISASSDTDFTTGYSGLTSAYSNQSGTNYIAYLFASLDNVSKVFSATKSSGSDASVNCGFSAGPRFVLLKRTDSTGDWYVWDSERGIVSGNDPYLLLNSTAAEVTSTDYIDPTSNGFTIVNGGLADGDYIGYAVA
jgi:hypothetical protein